MMATTSMMKNDDDVDDENDDDVDDNDDEDDESQAQHCVDIHPMLAKKYLVKHKLYDTIDF